MNETEPDEVWLPTTEQLVMASERAILAALDANLLLAARTLQAEHASGLSDGISDEPSPPHLALTQSILILAASLRQLIASYELAVEHLLGDG